jgi:hypothetical protein
MNIFSYVCLLPYVYTRDLPLSTAWIPALIWGLHAITPEFPKHRFTTTERDMGLVKGYRNETELGHLCISRRLAPTLSFFLSIAFRLLVTILVTSESGSGHYGDCLLTYRRKPTLISDRRSVRTTRQLLQTPYNTPRNNPE